VYSHYEIHTSFDSDRENRSKVQHITFAKTSTKRCKRD
jgi:hypothetical protein